MSFHPFRPSSSNVFTVSRHLAMKPHLFLTAAALAAFAGLPALAFGPTTTVSETYGPFTPGTAIADNQAVATSFLASVSSSAIDSLSDVSLLFELRGTPADGGFANDMFASLLRSPLGGPVGPSDPAAVLLNRVGGFYDGWNIRLSGAGAGNVRDAVLSSGVLSGLFQPDNPAGAATFDVFDGLSGNGDWRFNVADLAQFGQMELVSWSLTLTGESSLTAVPEASTWAAGLGLAALVGGGCWRARRRAQGC